MTRTHIIHRWVTEIWEISSDYFPVERSIRQGCPMSMISYIIFQEPFFLALKASTMFSPISLPNGFLCSMVGYADDVSVFVDSDESILEVDNVIKQFERATGAELNRNKTSIMGIGLWKDRVIWPIDWLYSKNSVTILGINFSNDYLNFIKQN